MFIKKKKKNVNENIENSNNNDSNLDNEIIIGLTKIPEPEIIKKKSKKVKKKNKKNKMHLNKKGKFLFSILIFIILLNIVLIITLYSPIFDIKNIVVNNNKSVSVEQIISLSKIKKNENTFKLNKKRIKENLKHNAYVENVEIKRIFPNGIELNIEERTPTFILKIDEKYAYINNQGFVLEFFDEKPNNIIIEGFITKPKDIKLGSRLENEDLEKLEEVLKIVEIANGNEIVSYISSIDISNKSNYKLNLESENKKVYLGDTTNLNTKVLYIKGMMEKEKENKGEIFVNMDLNMYNPYFRESV